MPTIVKSEVNGLLRKKGLRVSTDFYESLDRKVQALLDEAADRAKKNGRRTVMACDC
jgi:histone H3/H4